MIDFFSIATDIYRLRKWREAHRALVFVARAYLHYGSLWRLVAFFEETEARRAIYAANKLPIEQATRAFFYAGSTVTERVALIEEHFRQEEQILSPDWYVKLNLEGTYPLWRAAADDLDWYAALHMEPGQRKEGLLALDMYLGRDTLYQIMFWLGKNAAGERTLTIGAMQGPNMANARDVIKETTKRAHRYRTKNLILYLLQAVARGFGVERIYAVSNDGYYAMNHLRRDRKLKTDFGAFWEEAGGAVTEDARFYELPLTEHRKTMEEVPTRKRATYRKRYAFQDDVDAQVAAAIEEIRR